MAEALQVVYPPLEQMLAGDPRLARADLQHLQDWLAKQPHLPPMLDEELAPFLASSEYSLQRAKELVDKFWTMRTHAPELFSGRDPEDEENREQLEAFRVARLPRRTAAGQRVVVLGYAPAAAFDASRFDGARSLRLSTALMEMVGLQEAQADARAPLALLLDAHHVALPHLARTPLPALQRLMAFVQEAAPLRIEAVHVIRLGAIGHRALALVRPLMSPELQRMVCISTATAAVTTTTAAAVTNKTSPLAKARLPVSLLGSANESQQKQLNPQLLAYFLRPLASYLAALTGAAPTAALDNWDAAAAPAGQALPLAAAPSKLSLLASLFGFGQPAASVADGQNPSYAAAPF